MFECWIVQQLQIMLEVTLYCYIKTKICEPKWFLKLAIIKSLLRTLCKFVQIPHTGYITPFLYSYTMHVYYVKEL